MRALGHDQEGYGEGVDVEEVYIRRDVDVHI